MLEVSEVETAVSQSNSEDKAALMELTNQILDSADSAVNVGWIASCDAAKYILNIIRP